MKKTVFSLLCGLLLVNSPASAGLFADDDARKQIQQLEAKILTLETRLQNTEEQGRQRVSAILDLQMQLDVQAAELRRLQGRNEEWAHSLEELEKRQKDFYLDLDARLRQLEAGDPHALPPASASLVDPNKNVSVNPVGENRAFEAAYGLYKAESYQRSAIAFRDFLRQFPQSVHEANVYYWMGNAYFLAIDYANSLDSYQNLISRFQDHPRVAEAMLNVAECQLQQKSKAAAQKTLKQVVAQFPGSDAADKAKKRLASIK